jgi:hypothetical protein
VAVHVHACKRWRLLRGKGGRAERGRGGVERDSKC